MLSSYSLHKQQPICASKKSTMRGRIMRMRIFRGVKMADRTDNRQMYEVLDLCNGMVSEKILIDSRYLLSRWYRFWVEQTIEE